MTLANIPAHLLRAAAALPENRGAREALERALRDANPQPVPLSSPAPEVSRVRAEGVQAVSGKERRMEGLDSLRLTLYGAPRTKKTSNQLQRFGGRLKVVPSAAWMRWRDACLLQVNDSMRLKDQPYNLCALFYRDADRGDACGFLAGLCDVLQEAGVVSDDVYLKQFDGSRLLVDRERPRVEVTISALT